MILRMPRFTFRNIFSLKITGIVCKSCVRSAMRCGSETWCLGQSERNLQLTERAMVKKMCGLKLMDKKSTNDHKKLLEMNEIIYHMAKADCVRCIEICIEKG